MPSGDDVTGLHAFDGLDPVTAVSALNVAPDFNGHVPGRPASRPVSAPPPPPVRVLGRAISLPPPPPRGGSLGAKSIPPPPPARAYSAPPRVAVAQGDEESTKVAKNPFAEAFASLEAGQAISQADAIDTGIAPLNLPSRFVAPNISMEWDEDEAATRASRDTLPPPAALPDSWESEEEALTRVRAPSSIAPAPSASVWDSVPEGGSVSFAPTSHTLAGREQGRSFGDRLPWIALAAMALVGAALGARALFARPDAGAITLVTEPVDAQVSIDGRPLVGQTSPFTVQELEPGTEHVIEIRKDGFATQTHRFSIDSGDVRALPTTDLLPLHVDTGLALASDPPGASIFVNGRKLDQVTPARVTNLSQGLHLIRLEGGAGLEPWETQVALATGQVLELPKAQLVPAETVKAGSTNENQRVSPRRPARRTKRLAVRQRGAKRRNVASPSRAAPERTAVANAGGSHGTLRLNSRPWSQVFVDGRNMGTTPQLALALSPGKHAIKLVNPQLGMSKSFSVTIQAGKTATKIVELQE